MSDTAAIEKKSIKIKSVKGGARPGAGRPKGVPNKTTTQLKEALTCMVSIDGPDLLAALQGIEDPARRLDIYLKALEYHLPKLARMTVVSDEKPDDTPLTWGDGTV